MLIAVFLGGDKLCVFSLSVSALLTHYYLLTSKHVLNCMNELGILTARGNKLFKSCTSKFLKTLANMTIRLCNVSCVSIDCFQYMMMNLRVKSFLSGKVMSIMAPLSSWSAPLQRWLYPDWYVVFSCP